MFERFTDRARQVVVFAQDEARALGHDHIGTAHLLLGLIRQEEGLAARVLRELDVRIDDVRQRVVAALGPGDPAQLATGQMPFSPRAKKTLELSLRESQQIGHTHIGTEHLLLALMRLHEGVGRRIVADLGIDQERVRAEIVRVVSSAQRSAESPRPLVAPPTQGRPRGRRDLVTRGLPIAVALALGILIGWAIWGH